MLRAINDARAVTPAGVIEGATVVLEDGRISGLSRRPESGPGTLDAAGRYLLPGLVDLHSDAIEKQLAPRPGVELPVELAFLEMDRYLATSGITTGFHALSLMSGSGRSLALGRRLHDVVHALRDGGLVRHESHLRCELPEPESVAALEEILNGGGSRLVSVMDHTPGQGQFRDLEWFRRYWSEDRGMDEARISAALERAGEGEAGFAAGQLERVARAARSGGAVLASHDDDTPEKVELVASNDARISEFVINESSARRARELGLYVSMGAPNVVRGRSSGGNLCATEAVRAGLVDTLCSDYHPPSLLQAAFKLAGDGLCSLSGAVALVTAGPAGALKLADRGELREGATADLVLVGGRFGLPTVTHTLLGGELVFTAG